MFRHIGTQMGTRMGTFLLSRILSMIPVLFVVALISFIIFTYVGDPVVSILGQDFVPEQRDMLIKRLGLDQPIYMQFLNFLGNIVQGNFGSSYRLGQPVYDLLIQRFPATLELAFSAAVLATIIGVPLGVYTGLYRNSWLSHVMMTVSLIGVSLPTFLIGILLILIFSVYLGVLPSFGRGELTNIGGWQTGFLTLSGLRALILPSITLGLFQLALVMRLVRSEMIEVLRTDFIKFARARGLPDRVVYFSHALKNTLVPVITIIGLQLGSIIAFAIVTETVFQWPGVGLLFIQSVSTADVPVMSAYLILVAAMYVIINLVVDALYFIVDPRMMNKAK